jgi:hypothetical protein
MENSALITLLYALGLALTTEILNHYFPSKKWIAGTKDFAGFMYYAMTEPFTMQAQGSPLQFALHALAGTLLYVITRRALNSYEHARAS